MQQRQPPFTIIRTASLPGWAAVLGGIAAVGIAAALLAFSFVILMVIAPIAVGGYFYLRWKAGRLLRDAMAQRDAMQREADMRAGIIEGEFIVIEDEGKARRPTTP